MNFFLKFILILFFITNKVHAQNKWVIEKELSIITFEIPVLLTKDVNGKFNKFDGYVVIDLENEKNNKAIFSVEINSLEINYDKYIDLLFSDVFFDQINYPIAIIDTKKFSNPKELNSLKIEAELQIKNISNKIPIEIEIKHLANNWVQILANMKFSRNSFELGKGVWSSKIILNDTVNLKANLFLSKE